MQAHLYRSPDDAGGKPAETKTAPAPETKPDPIASELAELRAYRAEQQAKEAERMAAQKKAEEEAALKRGEHEKLYAAEKERAAALEAEVKTYKQREAARVKAVEAEAAEIAKGLSKELQEVVAEIPDPDKRLTYARKLAGAGGGGLPSGVMAGSGAKASAIPAEHQEAVKAQAAAYRMDPDAFWAKIYKPRLDRSKAAKA
jgi:hypothetical protein